MHYQLPWPAIKAFEAGLLHAGGPSLSSTPVMPTHLVSIVLQCVEYASF